MGNLGNSANAASRHLSRLTGNRAAAESALQIDRLIRSSCVGQELLAAVEDFQLFTVPSDEKSSVIDALVIRSIRLGFARLSRLRPRSLWGVTPIIQLANCAKADRMLGIEAETLVYTTYYITSDFDLNLKAQIDWICANSPEKLAAFQWMVFYWALLSYDIFHLYNDRGLLANVGGYGSNRFGISLEEMQILRRSRKRFYTYAYGADHRMREATLAMGKYNFCMDCPEIGKFCVCDDAGGTTMLATIGSYATAMVASGIAMVLIPNARNLFYLVLDLDRPQFSAPRRKPDASLGLRIGHAPNHGFFKGTQLLLEAVERLREKGAPVELVMLSGVPNEQVLELIASCDVLADQFISGSFGYTAIESMALGVPVMCYLSPDVEFLEPENLPIINCHPEHIEETILRLVDDRESLRSIGERSREYVRRNYSVEAFSRRLRDLYLDTGTFPWGVRKWLWTGRKPPLMRRWLMNAATAFYQRAVAPAAYRTKRVIASAVYRTKAALKWVIDAGASCTLILAASIGRVMTRRRLHRGRPRTLWGVTPILTLPLLARCDRLLGFYSESVVVTTYHVSKRFDVNLQGIRGKVLERLPAALMVLEKLCLAWALLRFDVFHYFYDRGLLAPTDFRIGINPAELKLLRRAGKMVFCYAYGADVRTRNATLALGKYNLCVSCPSPMKYCMCDDALGAANIANISANVTAMVSMGDMLAYVPGCRNQHYWPIDVERFPFVGVNRVTGAPLRIAHVPNHAHFKGTSYLDEAVGRLRSEGYDIEVLYAQGVPNEKVIEIYSAADVVADQFVSGFHGYAALEAMALGKPVLCFLRGPEMVLEQSTCPIVSTNPENLYSTLRDVLENRIDLVDLGRRGREYIVKFYSLEATAGRQGEMYLRYSSGYPRMQANLKRQLELLSVGGA